MGRSDPDLRVLVGDLVKYDDKLLEAKALLEPKGVGTPLKTERKCIVKISELN